MSSTPNEPVPKSLDCRTAAQLTQKLRSVRFREASFGSDIGTSPIGRSASPMQLRGYADQDARNRQSCPALGFLDRGQGCLSRVEHGDERGLRIGAALIGGRIALGRNTDPNDRRIAVSRVEFTEAGWFAVDFVPIVAASLEFRVHALTGHDGRRNVDWKVF